VTSRRHHRQDPRTVALDRLAAYIVIALLLVAMIIGGLSGSSVH
jgi:hypothetical protein